MKRALVVVGQDPLAVEGIQLLADPIAGEERVLAPLRNADVWTRQLFCVAQKGMEEWLKVWE